MRAPALGFLIVGLLIGCSADWQPRHRASATPAEATQSFVSIGTTLSSQARASFASLPDRGDLLAYDRSRPVRRGGAYTWHPVELSEAHALRAVVGGELVVTAPNGQPIRLRYERHVEHKDGNWTWIGRVPGSQPGTEAILTFGEKAAFGSIPYGDEEPLRMTIAGGSAWLVETDRRRLALMDNTGTRPRRPDHRVPPRLLQRPKPVNELFSAAQSAEAVVATDVTAAATTTVDLLLGYTNGFATRLGGQSQANTRLTFLVDIANQAYANSQVSARLRLVRTQQVTYPDTTANETALYNLSGVECTEQPNGNLNCTYVGVPAALQPLVTARNQYGADLVSLVRNFNDPENDGCGLAWLLGAGQEPIVSSDADFGISVIGDSSGNMFPDNGFICRDETLAHEAGHNMGSNHDRETAEGDDGVLDPEDYGRYPYSFGHKTAAGTGNFYTVMAYGDSGQTKYRVFSNPDITYCGGYACGVANVADNARSLRATIPIIASFLATKTIRQSDFDGDGKSDVLWRNAGNGANALWKSANSATGQTLTAVADLNWKVVGVGDFDGDGASDILWRHFGNGKNSLWSSANSAMGQALTTVADLNWKVVGVGDFDGDGESDILWRHFGNGKNSLWRSANSAMGQTLTSVADLNWKIVGVGDFDGDGKSDILWRHFGNGKNSLWRSANSATGQALTPVADLNWKVVGVGDFDGDGKSDILWRHFGNGNNSLWKSANSATGQALTPLADLNWKVVGVGDFDGDGKSDILWRNFSSGGNALWKSADWGQGQTLTSSHLSWMVVP